MPYLLLGPDDFSKKFFIDDLATKLNAEIISFSVDDAPPTAGQISQTDLFAKAKVFWFREFVPDFFEGLNKNQLGGNQVVASVASLDKRKKESKSLLGNKNIEVKQFDLPHGAELNSWITSRVKSAAGSISAAATEELAIRLGRDQAKETKVGGKIVEVEEVYTLWQADSEIQKLLAYAQGGEISAGDVKALAAENREVDVFELTNALAEKHKQKSLDLLQRLLKEQNAADEKGAIIQLNALVSEQFRNVAMVQDFLNRKTSEAEILEKTGWKSGRLFVIKKIASRFAPPKILDLLNKLKALDEELKTSSTPPRVLLDLIVAQLL